MKCTDSNGEEEEKRANVDQEVSSSIILNEGESESQQTEEIDAECKKTAEIESALVPSGEIAEASNVFDADKSIECSVTNENTEKDESFIPETQCDTTTDFKMESNNLDSEETSLEIDASIVENDHLTGTDQVAKGCEHLLSSDDVTVDQTPTELQAERNVSQIDNEKYDVIECDDSITMPHSQKMVDNDSTSKTEDEIIAKTINQMEIAESDGVNSESVKTNEEKIPEDVDRFEDEEMSTDGAIDDCPSLPVIADEDIVNNTLLADSTVPKSGVESNGQISDVSTNLTLVSKVSNGPENDDEETSFAVHSEIASSENEGTHCEQLDNGIQDKLQDSFFDTSSHYAKTESSAVSSMFNDSAQMTEGMVDILYYDICFEPPRTD